MGATIVNHNGQKCRIAYKRLPAAKVRTGWQIWDVNARDWVDVVKVERADRWAHDYNITTAWHGDQVTNSHWHNHELRTRRFVPVADQSRIVALPEQRTAGTIAPLLTPGRVITVRPRLTGQPFKLVVTECDSYPRAEATLLMVHGQVLNMQGRPRWFRRTGLRPRPRCVFVKDIDLIEEPTDGAQ